MSTLSPLATQKEWIKNYHFAPRIGEQGKLVAVGDGIVWIEGLPSAAIDEVLSFEDGSRAMVFHLTETLVGAILLEQTGKLTAGTLVRHAGSQLRVPVGDELLSRVIDPMGMPLDGGRVPQCKAFGALDVRSPPILERDFVSRPLLSGNKIVDTLIPIGKGQWQLLIGDNGLGKSSLAIDMVVNQKDKRCPLCLRSDWAEAIERTQYLGNA